MTKLLPCPFCGSTPEVEEKYRAGKELCVIQCTNTSCPSMVARTYLDTFEKASKAWNTRYSRKEQRKSRMVKIAEKKRATSTKQS